MIRQACAFAALTAATPVLADAPRIAVDIAPVHSLVAMVAGEDAEVSALVPPGVSPHNITLRPSQASDLGQADLIIQLGLGFAPWLDDARSRLAASTPMLILGDVPGISLLPARDGGAHDHDHGHDHGHDEHAEAGHDDHGHEEHAEAGHDDHDHEEHAEAGHDDHDHEKHAEAGHDDHDHEEHAEAGHDDHDHEEHAEAGHDDHGHEEHAEAGHDDHDHDEHAEAVHDDHGHEEHAEAGHDDHDHAEHAEAGHDDHGHEEHAEAGHDDHDHEKHAEAGHDDHDHEEHAEAGHDDHDHEEHAEAAHLEDGEVVDAHFWLDPRIAAAWLPVIAAELSEIDPDGAEGYAARAEAAVARMEALDTEIRAKIASDAKPFAILHDAIQYFEVAYDVDSVGALTGADATEGGPRRRSTLSEALEVSGEICLLHEVGEADAAADLARETGTTAVEIDPLGAKLDLGPGLYEATMLGLAETIAACTNP